MKNKNKKRVLIVAGGTAGHVFPAIEVANKFYKNGYNISFVTDKRMYEFLSKKKHHLELGIDLFCFYGRGFSKNNYFYNINSSFYLIMGVYQSLINILFFRPQISIGFGGYITVPILVVSHIFRINVFIHEGNSVVGRANKLLYLICKKMFINFEKVKTFEESNNKLHFVGMPIKKDILKLSELKYKPCKDGFLNLLITGGSLGAEIMATKISLALVTIPLKLRKKLKIIQQVRKENYSELKKLYEKYNINFRLENFIENMPSELSKADIIICRSGAATISENLIAGIPAIMIPLASSSDNHQFYNADFIEKKGAGWLIRECELSKENLVVNKLKKIFTNLENLDKVSQTAKKLAILNSTDRIVRITSSYIKKN